MRELTRTLKLRPSIGKRRIERCGLYQSIKSSRIHVSFLTSAETIRDTDIVHHGTGFRSFSKG